MLVNLALVNNYSIITCTTVLQRKDGGCDIKIQVSTYMTGISCSCDGATDSDLSYDKYILRVKNVSKTQVNN